MIGLDAYGVNVSPVSGNKSIGDQMELSPIVFAWSRLREDDRPE